MSIAAALSQLDVGNDEHWTQDDLPRLDVVSKLLGHNVSRKEITDVAPDFSRTAATPKETPDDETALSGAVAEAEADLEVDPSPTDLASALAITSSQLLMDRSLFEKVGKLLDNGINERLREIERLKIEIEHYRKRFSDLWAFELNTRPKGNAQIAHIKRQHEIRMQRALQTKSVLSGMSPEDVKAALNVRSPLDTVMRARKPGPGSQRPQLPLKAPTQKE